MVFEQIKVTISKMSGNHCSAGLALSGVKKPDFLTPAFIGQ